MFSSLEMDLGNSFQPGKKEKRLKKRKKKTSTTKKKPKPQNKQKPTPPHTHKPNNVLFLCLYFTHIFLVHGSTIH